MTAAALPGIPEPMRTGGGPVLVELLLVLGAAGAAVLSALAVLGQPVSNEATDHGEGDEAE